MRPVATTLSWGTPFPLAGDESYYLVYRGRSTNQYDSSEVVPFGTNTLNVLGLGENTRYYFVATCVDTSGNESAQSNEVTKMIPKFSPAIFV